MDRPNAWNTYDEVELKKLEKVNAEYREMLDKGKTERECVTEAILMAEACGYENLETVMAEDKLLKTGDKVYHTCMDRAIILYHIGEELVVNGMNILGAHIDSPRIDIKQVPLFEDKGYVYLDTHYYGGIRKYQWLSTPLALHGVVYKKDGTKIEVAIGEKETDPVFVITDLLPHLAQAQSRKPAGEFVNGEKLDLLIGNKPGPKSEDEKKDAESVQDAISKLLKEMYGIEEADFQSAELQIVPAMKARECGLDRSMIMGYGQDDRVCAFTSLMAMLEMKDVKRTACCIFADKEEIGSVGATGMASNFFENSVAELMDRTGDYSSLKLKRALAKSFMLSSDVSAAYDPMYAENFEAKNSAFFGKGLAFNKYTGARGKNGSSDASPEFVAKLRKIMDENGVLFQTAELGAVDIGGGGTIAYLMAKYGMHVIDSGVPVLGMHSLYEVASKADIYEAYKGYKAFLVHA
ncbi:MAG: aminopeptidase [Eubacteriales bacterium]